MSGDDTVYGLEIDIFDCNFGSSEFDSLSRFDGEVLRRLENLGCKFYEAAPYPSREISPYALLKSDGSAPAPITMSHPCCDIAVEGSDDPELAEEMRMEYWSGSSIRSFLLFSGFLRRIDDHFADSMKRMQIGRLNLFNTLIPTFRPRFAFVDRTFGTVVKQQHLESLDLRKLFWVNYFGEAYVATHGKEFLMNTPAYKVSELAGGVCIIVTESYMEFVESIPKDTIAYLKRRFTNIRPNRFQIHSAF